MIKLVFLGTVSGAPSKHRFTTSFALVYNNSSIYLFDCAEGTTKQLRVAELSLHRIRAIFITHFHGDHYLGLPGLLMTMSLLERTTPLKIFGPKGTKEFVRHLLSSGYFELTFPLEIVEVPSEKKKIYEEKDFIVESFPANHGIPAVGYIFREKPKLKVSLEKLAKYGLEPGPLVGKLKRMEPVEVNGRLVRPEDVLVDTRSDISIYYSGDTRPLDYQEPFDVVIHEATFASKHKDLAKERFHSTADEVAKIAAKNGVKLLILVHFSQRYEKDGFKEIERDAKKYMKNVILADDLMSIELNKRQGKLEWRVSKPSKQETLI
jgi:ribonuclease Z